MKREDLDVAAQNAAKKDRQFQIIVENFTTYSMAHMQTDVYAEYVSILDLVIPPGLDPVLFEKKNEGRQLIFDHKSEDHVTPFRSKGPLSWEELVRDWAAVFSEKDLGDAALAESFWQKFAENIDSRAYGYRMDHDDVFHQTEIARLNAEHRRKNQERSSREWKSFFKWCLLIFGLALVVYFLV